MAKRPRRQPTAKDIGDRIIDATLELIVVHGWSPLPLSQIARSTGLSLEDLYATFPSKAAILSAYFRRVDTMMASAIAPEGEPDATARDRVFEVVMARFDALAPQKEAVRTIVRDLRCDPAASLCAAPTLRRSVRWMLECADLSSTGIKGLLRVNGLAVIYLRAFGVWLRDDSDDMAKTMASLDNQLARAENFIRRSRLLEGTRSHADISSSAI
jgi:AcrR family transcriptional regulator